MKDIYKQKVINTLDSSITKIKVVKEMVTGDRPAVSKTATSDLELVMKSLHEIQEVVERG